MVINFSKKFRVNQNFNKSKKAQVKIQQMAFMLLAVFIFFALVAMLILNFKVDSIKKDATDLQQKNAQLLISKLANSPEFSCQNSFISDKVNCIDFDKALVLSENIEIYKNFWGASNIEIRKIYPIQEEILCDRQNYPNCNVLPIISGQGTSYSNFVILCRKEVFDEKIYNKCDLGEILVGYENVE